MLAPLCREEAESPNELFASTRWTTVLKAGDSAATSADALSARRLRPFGRDVILGGLSRIWQNFLVAALFHSR